MGNRKRNNRKGSVMVEAALIFPLIIGAVLLIIYITMWYYQELYEQSKIHLSIRKESGEQSETILRMEEEKHYPTTKGTRNFFPTLISKHQISGQSPGLFSQHFMSNAYGEVYVVDDTMLVRVHCFLDVE